MSDDLRMARLRSIGLTLTFALTCAGCGSASDVVGRSTDPRSPNPVYARNFKAFPEGATFDYQIGGAYPPAAGVRIVDRDRSQKGVSGRFNICYVNAYQAQPGELEWWKKEHPDLLLRDKQGALVIDKEWNEALLDISTPTKRKDLAVIVGNWFAGCGRFGHDAVEPDNLDSYTRSNGLLTQADAIDYAAGLARQAHTYKRLIGQKNASELAPQLSKAGYDFAVAEECQQYDECGAYTGAYGRKVIEIEYDAAQFAAACTARSGKVSLLLRDRDVVPRGAPGYLDKTC